MKTVRCAIYTRKSSEEGLDQAFNSLDAQREACAAYVLSQASEGWTALPDIYDDGGLSGGSLERPALQRLLSDVAAGKVDIIVVYKVDRLTRSLLDFAKLVEAFDKAGTSFVSITQSFNTTTSMGRLTLNMLLSFAQFEREVTAERIRDKIAASKAKGMWMGGTPPLGYKPNGRSLAIVEEHATIIRGIYHRYLELGNVRLLAGQLVSEGISSPTRKTATGRSYGGGKFGRGQLYFILKNRIYAGDIAHRASIYAGTHPPLIDRETWNKVQERLADQLQGARSGGRAEHPSPLSGLIVDATGEVLVATHACKGKTRYRYYVSRQLQDGPGGAGMRIPALEIETAVGEAIASSLADPLALAVSADLAIEPTGLRALADRSDEAARLIRKRDRTLLRELVSQIRIMDGRIEIDVSSAALGDLLQAGTGSNGPGVTTLHCGVRLTRSGRAVRLIRADGTRSTSEADPSLLKLVLRARRWWRILRRGEVSVSTLAVLEGVSASYLTRVLRLAFLAPSVIDDLLAGTVRATVDGTGLTASDAIAASWSKQRRSYGAISL